MHCLPTLMTRNYTSHLQITIFKGNGQIGVTVWVLFRNYLTQGSTYDQCSVLFTELCQVFCAQYSNVVSENKLIFGFFTSKSGKNI